MGQAAQAAQARLMYTYAYWKPVFNQPIPIEHQSAPAFDSVPGTLDGLASAKAACASENSKWFATDQSLRPAKALTLPGTNMEVDGTPCLERKMVFLGTIQFKALSSHSTSSKTAKVVTTNIPG